MKTCSICNRTFEGYGNNPEPLKRFSDGPCCDRCHVEVIKARVERAKEATDV